MEKRYIFKKTKIKRKALDILLRYQKPIIKKRLQNFYYHTLFWKNLHTHKRLLFKKNYPQNSYIKKPGIFFHLLRSQWRQFKKVKTWDRLKRLKRRQTRNKNFVVLFLLKIPGLLLQTPAYIQYKTQQNFTKIGNKYLDLLNKKCQNLFFITNSGWKYYLLQRKNINLSWQIFKKIKQQNKLTKRFEARKLKRLQNFYRNFGFRKNKHRIERRWTRTKKFKKFKIYEEILHLARHKTKLRRRNNYLVQACRTRGPSYYKIKEQLFCYWQRNYFSNNLTKKKIDTLRNKSNRYKKNRLIKFIAQITLTISSFLLQTRLLKTIGIVHQFIKHGNVYVNFKKILSPAYVIKPGDTISIYIHPCKQKYNRLNDPLYTNRLMQGLYRKNTGRQSLIIREKQPDFIKTSLDELPTVDDAITPIDKNIMHDILPFSAKDRITLNSKLQLDLNNTNTANWKIAFLAQTITGSFIQQNKYIPSLNNNLA